jgi:hypothetical protein
MQADHIVVIRARENDLKTARGPGRLAPGMMALTVPPAAALDQPVG